MVKLVNIWIRSFGIGCWIRWARYWHWKLGCIEIRIPLQNWSRPIVCVHCAWLKWRVRFERVSKAIFLWSIAAIIWVSTTGWNPFLRSILVSMHFFLDIFMKYEIIAIAWKWKEKIVKTHVHEYENAPSEMTFPISWLY